MTEAKVGKQPARAYVQGEPNDPVAMETFATIRARGGEPVTMHRVLAVAPNVFAATYDLAITLRTKTSISRPIGELMILRTMQIEGGDYEFAAHRLLALRLGLTEEQIDSLHNWRAADCYAPVERAVLAYADALGGRRHVPDDIYDVLASHMSSQEIVELTMTAGFYVAAARLSAGLDMHVEH